MWGGCGGWFGWVEIYLVRTGISIHLHMLITIVMRPGCRKLNRFTALQYLCYQHLNNLVSLWRHEALYWKLEMFNVCISIYTYMYILNE